LGTGLEPKVSRVAGPAGALRALARALRRRLAPLYRDPFLAFAPPGHFYSPLPDLEVVARRRETLFDLQARSVPGIDLRAAEQLALIGELAAYHDAVPFPDDPGPGRRYHFRNGFFTYGDAVLLYALLRHRRPRRIVEVGSGFSSAAMLDTNDLCFDGAIEHTFIEPHPERLYALLSAEDRRRHEVLVQPVQEVALDRFQALAPGDILFIDSSHVAKVGSDVVHLLTHVLPALRPGVLIHFHDVFWPFEYPEEWLRQGIAWNEAYVLKAFLQFNTSFAIRLFSSYLAVHHRAEVGRMLPLFLKHTGGSLWIEKTA
jgi:predicted O-methyltransferase YrrM